MWTKCLKLWTYTIICIILLAGISMNVSASEPLFECHTDPELMQETHDALVRKKLAQLNTIQNIQHEKMKTRQMHFATGKKTIMPSTGDVKVLVVPIEFQDYKLEDFAHEQLNKFYFDEQDISDRELKYKDLSFRDYFKKVSFNKLRLSGKVLPVYSASENREYYESSGLFAQEIAKAIQLNKDNIGDLSEYDSDNDGYIDCLHVIWAGPVETMADAWWSQIWNGGDHELYGGKKCLPLHL